MWLRLLLCCIVTGAVAGSPPVDAQGVKGWCQEPRLGEAKKPGPLTNFDDDDADGWVEDADDLIPLPGEESWAPETDDEAWENEQQQQQQQQQQAQQQRQ